MFGRFELKRVLGEGAQATVWLGFDARLEREVAVKLMRADAAADPVAVSQWLQEARSVSRLTHPNIVPVFEADVHEQQPYLVFEYVPGPTLAQHLKARGALPAHEAVALMVGVLDALHTAHSAGVVHRDLKPSNILVDSAGRARVMDFGIAARLHDTGNLDQVVGTPGYMSPEATQGGLPTATMDVFSAGLVLVELLCGSRLIQERDPYRAMHRVASEDLTLPASLSAEVDDALRALLLRAIERGPARRWQSAAAFRDALQAWLAPVPTAGDARASGGRNLGGSNATLEFLLRRMRHKSDFPALSDSVARIQRVVNGENESLASLSGEILKDVALTNKLLRLVNSAQFSSAGGTISTVSRAVALVGFAGIRNMTMSLVLLEHMHDKAQANQLKEEFLRSLMAGMLASELGAQARDSEEAFIGAMFQNLGRLLTEYYFADEARQVRGIVAGNGPAGAAVGEEAASVSVLGLSFEALGLGIAKVWGLPAALQGCMRKPCGEPPVREPTDAAERLRWLTFASNQIADTLLRCEPTQSRARVSEVAQRYARTLGVDVARIEAAAETAQQRLAQMAQAMNLQVAPQSPARRLLAAPAPQTEATTIVQAHDSLVPHSLQATVTLVQQAPRSTLETASEVLTAGIQDITNSMVEDFRLNDVLRMVLETMYRALGFRRIVFCLRDAKTDTLTGRFGLGEGAEAVAASFKVPLKAGADLFTAVCVKGADTLITDATVAHIEARLPAWYRKSANAPAFLLLPMHLRGAPFALIYADKAVAGGIELGQKELSLLRTLRNQAVMAFKQVT
ncbi:MAG: HDOD domain-containing protein [Burkholderiales bacterium]|nr:HDOD domain-containing protein [Burkholderiales bacterium]